MTGEEKREPLIFGIRHLSPAGAYYLRKTLDKQMPDVVLIEGPSDFTPLINEIVRPGVKPPFAIMAYTKTLPIRTILYPFAEYFPEYQAIVWAIEHGKECRFMDLPSSVFLALSQLEERDGNEAGEVSDSVSEGLLKAFGEDGQEAFWERCVEHCDGEEAYQKGASEYGRQLRQLDRLKGERNFWAGENVIREAYMGRCLALEQEKGTAPEKICVVTGSYHVEGLKGETAAMTAEEEKGLPALEAEITLMPYSYYRLSSRSGYGAGNKAPAYYELLWEGFNREESLHGAYKYLSKLASCQRAQGGIVSSAEVIEAVRLAKSLAELSGYPIPALKDLRDAAVTCMGHGSFGEISVAAADTEIGTKIGELPEGVSKTSVQSDFYRLLEELRLEKYKSVTAQDLSLDLRERLNIKSEEAARLDLTRSFFLHRLRVLGISFVRLMNKSQDKATWAEDWVLCWTPEAEIQIVETVLKGETIERAASFELKEQVEKSGGIAGIARTVKEAFLCGMPESAAYGIRALQQMAVEEASLSEIGKTLTELSLMVQYGDIRKLDREPLIPLLEQLFLRACLIMPESCICDDNAAKEMIQAIEAVNEAALTHDFLEEDRIVRVLMEIGGRDDLNTRLSGFCTAILLERGRMGNQELETEVERRLSRGIPADLGAGWFEGLSMKNHYALIARLGLWESLSLYMDSLEDEEFKRALVFLRRAFCDFTAKEKSDIAENLGEIWQINPMEVSEMLTGELDGEAKELLNGLEEFDFGDI